MKIKINYAETKSFAQDIKVIMDEYNLYVKDLESLINEIEANSNWTGSEKEVFIARVRGTYLPSMKQLYDESLKYVTFINKESDKYLKIEEDMLQAGKGIVL